MEARDEITAAVDAVRLPDEASRAAARARQLTLTKPAGALGRLEDLAVWCAGVRREPMTSLRRPVIVVAAADHGVAAGGVSAYPTEVTVQMVHNFLAGGAAINVLAAQAGAEVRVVDAGVASDIAQPRLHAAKVRRGTGDITRSPAMSREDAEVLIARGVAFARRECAEGADAIALGDMGIGNTTAAAAITSARTGSAPAVTVGRGTGIDDAPFALKVDAVARALGRDDADPGDGIALVASIGGCEIAFLAGVAIGAAASSVPVVLDGYPTTAAALVAVAICPASVEYMLAAHTSAEPGHRIALEHLGLRPLLDFGMRLGEGSGAALALMLLAAALRIPREMATFEQAGVATSAIETQPEQ
jgi:nicotinate-nucleotide--dimethylbenzimidazole phosphoribosyltransferase